MLASAFRNALLTRQPMSWAQALLISSVAVVATGPAIAALYLVKSAMGINLLDGPSPLHDLLYHFVR